MTRRRGFTLVELLFHIFLLGILLTAIYGIFVIGFRYSRQAQGRMDLQNAAQTAFMNLEAELSQTDVKSLIPAPTPAPSPAATSSAPGIVFISAFNPIGAASGPGFQEDLATGLPSWQKWVCYYVSPTGQFIRVETAVPGEATSPAAYAPGLPGTTLPTGASAPADVTAFLGSTFGGSGLIGRRVVAEAVSGFAVTPMGADAVTVSLAVSASVLSANDYCLNLADTVKLRN